jgi:hypothetical protein
MQKIILYTQYTTLMGPNAGFTYKIHFYVRKMCSTPGSLNIFIDIDQWSLLESFFVFLFFV